MTERQSLALANQIPADDFTSLTRFAETIRGPHQSYGTILTVDRRTDGLWWHAAVSVLSMNLKPIPHSGLSHLARKAAERLARELLTNVGQPDTEQLRWDAKSVHLICCLSAEEERQTIGRSLSAGSR